MSPTRPRHRAILWKCLFPDDPRERERERERESESEGEGESKSESKSERERRVMYVHFIVIHSCNAQVYARR